jgi:hypothetical protein
MFYTHYLMNDTPAGRMLLEIKSILVFCTDLSETFVITRRIQRDTVPNVLRYSSKISSFLSEFNDYG